MLSRSRSSEVQHGREAGWSFPCRNRSCRTSGSDTHRRVRAAPKTVAGRNWSRAHRRRLPPAPVGFAWFRDSARALTPPWRQTLQQPTLQSWLRSRRSQGRGLRGTRISKALCLAASRTRSSAWVTRTRLCVRCGRPALFVGFAATASNPMKTSSPTPTDRPWQGRAKSSRSGRRGSSPRSSTTSMSTRSGRRFTRLSAKPPPAWMA